MAVEQMGASYVIVRQAPLSGVQVEALRASVGWENVPGLYDHVLAHSYAHFSVWTAGGELDRHLIGFVNVISDGVADALLTDLVVHPDYHRQGIGRALVERAVDGLLADGVGFIQVIFVPDLEPFYRQCGFQIIRAGVIDRSSTAVNDLEAKSKSMKTDLGSLVHCRPLSDEDRPWAAQLIRERWGADIVVAHSVIYRPAELAGFVAIRAGVPVGLVTYVVQFTMDGASCEIVSLDSLSEGQGIGTALLGAVRSAAVEAGCCRLWLITTNDNLHALGFYQKRGFVLVAVHRGAITAARKIKPEIPLLGAGCIPLRDEIELELVEWTP